MPPACAAGSGVALGDPRWQCAIPELNLGLRSEPPDTALPALPQLTDPVKACALLQGGLAAGAPVLRGLRLAGCTPRLLRYHPGSRCTIAYGLRYDPDAPPGWPDQVIAKAYADDQAGAAWTAMRVLWRSTLADHPMVALAEPLAWLAPLRVVVQRWLPGMQPLDRLVRASVTADAPAAADALEPAVRAAAEALAALHHTDVRHGPEVSLLDELAATRATLAQLARLTPGPDTWAAPLLDRIAGDAAALPADPARPAHRSFHPAQLLLDPARQRVGIIDFDGLCMAEPALDVARFRAALRYLGRQRPRGADPATGQRDPDLPDRLDRIADAFLDQYQAVAPVSRARVWLWETLDLFGYVLHCWTKARPHRARDTVQLLRRHLDAGRAARPT
jgi:hypothetical protein